MRSLALPVLCVTPTLFVFACGDNRPTDVDDGADNGDQMAIDSDESGSEGGDKPREIRASLDIHSPSCDAAVAGYEALVRYADDSTFVPKVRCRVTFDDGAVADTCAGEHTFASAGSHTFILEVEDLATGATTRVEATRRIDTPLEVDLTLDVPECGLEFAFETKLSTSALVHVTMSPADKVVEPLVIGRTGRFQAREPGTYTINVHAEDERPVGPICVRELSRTVELRACHDHEPGCGH